MINDCYIKNDKCIGIILSSGNISRSNKVN